ncbi:MAG: cation-translocating P-type ATPase [Deltaproteobacteria bacterium]|jgi:Ca2+-transporting ATPase|nr:cation-translocating P-type ATPase [Deltaproteobacteria bacterium]
MRETDPGKFAGLTEQKVANRLKEEGYNELPSSKPRSIFTIAFEVIREPMFLLLLACGVIYLILGDLEEALVLLGFVLVVMGITLYQERKTERALEALRDLSSPRALVVRDGEVKRIPGREVVRDDILVLAEGDRVPADAAILSCTSLSTDESLLTGESAPVRKVACGEVIPETALPGGDDLPFVYSGTLVVQGQGIACVRATGPRTELGKIGKALQTVDIEGTPLQRETGRLVRYLACSGIFLCALVIIVYGLTRADWLNAFLAGITLAMAMLPEEFPVVLTIFLALGAWRISQKNVLTRRVPAVESLGAATVLCVDKTGTLTINRMSVTRVFARGGFYSFKNHGSEPLPEAFHELVEFAILAGQNAPFDPMERALKKMGERYLGQTEHIHRDWVLVQEYPLSRSLLSLCHVWRAPGNNDYVIAAKGAPEAIVDLCHLEEAQTAEVAKQVQIMASDGLRVLGVAKSAFKKESLPGGQHDFPFEFVGLLGFSDPVRRGVQDSIKVCSMAGVRVVMITGDYPATAQSIAKEIGLAPPVDVITGSELDKMDDLTLQERIKSVNIFARVVPEQKLRLVNALKANGELVAMTGDGVNDAPALKAADIGIAMGARGTDVARESAALVLLDDHFSSIVQAVRLGRRIFDNLKRAIAYILAIHVPIAGLSLLPVFFKWPLILSPIHIAFLELIIDPACSIVFEAEPEDADAMRRPPRNPKEPLFGKMLLMLSLLQGLSVLGIVLAVYLVALFYGQGEKDARTLAFTSLIVANLSLILVNRSWSQSALASLRKSNAALWWVAGGATAFLVLALYVPFLRSLFRFARLHPIDLAVCLFSGILGVLWFEFLKAFRLRRVRSAG